MGILAIHPSIRTASLHDLPVIVNVEKNAFVSERQASRETLLTRLQLFPQGCFVAEKGGEFLGFATSFITDDIRSIAGLDKPDKELHTPTGGVYHLRSLAVKKEFQRHGVGSALIGAVMQRARELGKQLFRFTAARDVESFYTKLRFQRISDYEEFHGVPQAIWEFRL